MRLLLALICAGFMFAGCRGGAGQGADEYRSEGISVPEASDLIGKYSGSPGLVLLDVRTKEEFEHEHIDGAINMDFYGKNFREELNALARDKIYIIYCRTDRRAGNTLPVMRNLGFREVYYLEGGMVEWKRRNMPAVREEALTP